MCWSSRQYIRNTGHWETRTAGNKYTLDLADKGRRRSAPRAHNLLEVSSTCSGHVPDPLDETATDEPGHRGRVLRVGLVPHPHIARWAERLRVIGGEPGSKMSTNPAILVCLMGIFCIRT